MPKKSNKKKVETEDKKVPENVAPENEKEEKETTEETTSDDKEVKVTMEDLKQVFLRDKQRLAAVDDEEDPNKPHAFWDTQPVPKLKESIALEESGPIDAPKTVQEVRQTPYALPDGFEWCETDVGDSKVMEEVYTLLNQNYVEDDDNMFRFDYSVRFLKWAITPPGFLKQWHIGVRVTKNQKLVGFITAIPANIHVYEETVKMVEINFLCVHKKLRDKRLAPVLIKEITRRVNLQNIWQATYTAGRVLPKPVTRCRYYHRSLNPKKLISVGFSHLHPKMTMMMTIKFYRVPETPQCEGIRALEKKDVPSATKLLNSYLSNFKLRPVYTEEEFEHWFTPISEVINTYVITNAKGEVTDMCSFYTLPSSIIGNEKYKILKAAYSYYNVATTVPLTKLMSDLLTFAKKLDYDVVNCLNLMENEKFLKDLKFGQGDGNLHYYLYNWKCPEMPPANLGLVLL